MPEVGVSEEGICCKIRENRIDMKHLYFSNYFIICLQSFLKLLSSLFVCQKCIEIRSNFVP